MLPSYVPSSKRYLTKLAILKLGVSNRNLVFSATRSEYPVELTCLPSDSVCEPAKDPLLVKILAVHVYVLNIILLDRSLKPAVPITKERETLTALFNFSVYSGCWWRSHHIPTVKRA
jgi:hypothetical protein